MTADKPWPRQRSASVAYWALLTREHGPEAFNLTNVHLVHTKGKGITEITENGPVFEGREYKLDLLI